MRINVYAEELRNEVEVITKKAENTGITFYGIRVYLESPSCLHNTEKDNDRSAITFWVPWTKIDGHDFNLVLDTLKEMWLKLEGTKSDYINKRMRGEL